MKLLHYGLQRSGTNYLETLLKKCYNVHLLNKNRNRKSPIHKHFRLYEDKEMIPDPQFKNKIKVSNFAEFEGLLNTVPEYYLIISKDPYSWLLSYEKWAKQCNWENVRYPYILEYNLFYKKWLEFSSQTQRIVFVRYIDLLRDSEKELHRLEAMMELKKRFLYSFFINKIDRVSQSGKFTNDRLNYYLEKKYLRHYKKERLAEVNAMLDHDVVSRLGYEIQNTPLV